MRAGGAIRRDGLGSSRSGLVGGSLRRERRQRAEEEGEGKRLTSNRKRLSRETNRLVESPVLEDDALRVADLGGDALGRLLLRDDARMRSVKVDEARGESGMNESLR